MHKQIKISIVVLILLVVISGCISYVTNDYENARKKAYDAGYEHGKNAYVNETGKMIDMSSMSNIDKLVCKDIIKSDADNETRKYPEINFTSKEAKTACITIVETVQLPDR